MKLLVFLIPPSIYHGCFTWKAFWEEIFTQVSMKIFGCCNVRKHKKINNGKQYINLDISLKFCNLENMKTTYSEPKKYLGISVKGLISSLGIKIIRRFFFERQGLPLMKSALRIFIRLLVNLSMCLIRVM